MMGVYVCFPVTNDNTRSSLMDFELDKFVLGRVLNEGEPNLTCKPPN